MITDPRRLPPLTPEEEAAVIEAYTAGHSLEDLGIRFRRSPPKIREVLVAAGIEIRSPSSARRINPHKHRGRHH